MTCCFQNNFLESIIKVRSSIKMPLFLRKFANMLLILLKLLTYPYFLYIGTKTLENRNKCGCTPDCCTTLYNPSSYSWSCFYAPDEIIGGSPNASEAWSFRDLQALRKLRAWWWALLGNKHWIAMALSSQSWRQQELGWKNCNVWQTFEDTKILVGLYKVVCNPMYTSSFFVPKSFLLFLYQYIQK